MERTIKPIETFYDGYRFRSRLEAHWAVFFNALGVEYEYEPEGFKLETGDCYLPDFRVACHGTRGECGENAFLLYVEVKGEMSKDDARKILTFAERKPILIVGNMPRCTSDIDGEKDIGFGVYALNYETIDGDHFGAYPTADEFGRFFLMGADSNYMPLDARQRADKAYAKARQARFDHGERG